VTVTVHVPTCVALRVEPVIEQPALPAFVTVYVTTPVPEPPLEVSVRGFPTFPVVLVSVRAAWVPCVMVTVVAAELTAA
jgi:hypothetical protein